VQSQLRPLHEQQYQIKKNALDTLITQRVLEAEAKEKGHLEYRYSSGLQAAFVLDRHSRSQTVSF